MNDENTSPAEDQNSENGGGKVGLLGRIAKSQKFNRLILASIITAGILVGLETYPRFSSATATGRIIDVLQEIILWIFVVEAAIKIGSFGSKPWRYFCVGWNVFDFIIVVVCFLPIDAEFAAVLRLARILRALRLVTALPRLQLLVAALLKAIPSLGYVGVLLLLHFYIYAVMGTFLFGENDPIRFGSLHESTLTLFEVLTLEGWNEVLNTQYLGSDTVYDEAWKELSSGHRTSSKQPIVAAAYFVSFIMLGTMIMLNLFTGVIIGSMEEAQSEASESTRKKHLKEQGFLTLRDELQLISEQLETLAKQISALQLGLTNSSGGVKNDSP